MQRLYDKDEEFRIFRTKINDIICLLRERFQKALGGKSLFERVNNKLELVCQKESIEAKFFYTFSFFRGILQLMN